MRQLRCIVPIAALPQRARTRRVDQPVPHRGHAAHNGGAHQAQHKGTVGRVKHAHHPLVAGKQARHATGRGWVDGEQIAGHINHAPQHATAGHVDAVVILGAEVQRGEVTVLELRRQRGIATHQRSRRIGVALGLKDLVFLDTAELADRAVHRAHPIGLRQRTDPRFQGAREEIVERGVAGDVGVGRLGHVDLVALDEPANHRRGGITDLRAGELAGQGGQGLLGDQVLRQYREGVGHGSSFWVVWVGGARGTSAAGL